VLGTGRNLRRNLIPAPEMGSDRFAAARRAARACDRHETDNITSQDADGHSPSTMRVDEALPPG
jgi:hypothetical protein